MLVWGRPSEEVEEKECLTAEPFAMSPKHEAEENSEEDREKAEHIDEHREAENLLRNRVRHGRDDVWIGSRIRHVHGSCGDKVMRWKDSQERCASMDIRNTH